MHGALPVVPVLILLAFLPAAQAQVYKWVGPDGSIQYSDRPPPQGAERIEIPPVQIYEAPRLPATTPPGDADEPRPVELRYERVRLASPGDDEAIRTNLGEVLVRLDVEPELFRGHRVEVLLDGNRVGAGAATRIELSNVDPGTHTLQARIIDSEGEEVAATEVVTFHILRSFVRP